jgi:ABC-type nickel/cobalt efflux system permease component RcnA
LAYEFFAFMVLALALGFKHSYDADHLVAVSNLIARSPSVRRAGLMSISWAIGHMLTAAILTVVLFTVGRPVLLGFLEQMEVAVAIMLVLIGVLGLLWEFNVFHIHEHWHGVAKHTHLHTWLHGHLTKHGDHKTMFSIGIVHGIASNDELFVLLVVALIVATLGELLLGVAVFSLGVVAGMVLFAVGLNYPIVRWGGRRVRRAVNVAVAVVSIVYALLLLVGYGGFNPIPAPVG